MRGPNKLPKGAHPKAVSEAVYTYHVSADISYEQRKNIDEYAKAHNCSKADVVRRALNLYFKPDEIVFFDVEKTEEPKKNRFRDKIISLTKHLSKKKDQPITIRFNESSPAWINDTHPVYNDEFVHHMLDTLPLILKNKGYLYFREVVCMFGLDPSKYKYALGWDEKHNDLKWEVHTSQNNDYIDITFNPFNLED